MSSTSDGLQPAEFAATAERAVAACYGLGLREQARHLADDGLLGVIAHEDVAGLDLPLSFAVPVVAAATSGLLRFPLLETILLGQLLRQSQPRIAEAVIRGEVLGTIAWQGSVAAVQKGSKVVLNGWVGRAPCAAEVDHVLVRVGAEAAALIPVEADGVVVDEGAGLDLITPEHGIRLENVTVADEIILREAVWARLSSDGNVLRAAAILGSADACLALAQEHASTRRQFGRALSYNQAIRHALARQKLGLEGMRHAITRSLADFAGELERDAAFLAASAYGASISEGALQIHGGMGFTWDVPVHCHIRRIRSLQAQGDAGGLIAALGRSYVAEIAPAADLAPAP